jgi:microcystin-dependent protein
MDIVSKINGDTLSATEFNEIPTELETLITTSGQTPSSSILDQVSIGTASYAAQGGVFCTDSGIADAYVVTQVSPFKAPYSLKNGLGIKFRPGNANTGGACTINPFGLGTKSIKEADGTTNPPANTLNSAQDIELRYDGTVFRLTGSSAGIRVPSGAVMCFAMNTAPSGWLECNGSAISRTTYAALFSSIGTTFGVGNGTTTFNIPDLRGYFVRGWANGGSVDSGRSFGSTQQDALQNITGSIDLQTPGTNKMRTSGGAGALASKETSSVFNDGASGQSTSTTGITFNASSSSGVRTSTETRPVNVALMYCIKI